MLGSNVYSDGLYRAFYFLAGVSLAFLCLIPIAANASTPLLGPINSDPLTQRGISPRILDVAIVPMSQGLRSESAVVFRQTLEDGSVGYERFRMIFDPDTDYGRDLYIELDTEPLRSARTYRRMLEVTMGADHWLREGDRIHSASSISLLSSEDGTDVIGFSYSAFRIPTSLQWVTQLAGKVFVVDGVLDRIELTGEDNFQRDGVRHKDYSMTVYFGEVEEHGGHVITAIHERFVARLNRQWIDSDVWSKTLSYSSEQFGDITWVDNDLSDLDQRIAGNASEASMIAADVNRDAISTIPILGEILDEELHSQDTIRLDLQRSLPFYANDVRKLGFELPKTYGLGIAAHYQSADIDMEGFNVAGIDVTGDLPLIDPLGSDLESDVLTGQLRADLWILPFLNVSLLLGEMETNSDVTLRFTPGFQNLVKLTQGADLPEFYTFDTKTTGTTAGIGLLTGFQYEQLVMSLGMNYLETITDETNAEIEAILWMGMVGYDFGAIGLQALVGVQYLDTDRTIEGRIDLENGKPLEFAIDIGLEETTFLVGFNKDIGRNWSLSSFLGANGTKSSLTANFGYRW
ncbi:MAG: hypothetical protein ABJN62_07410 [Halioglobus sp.]